MGRPRGRRVPFTVPLTRHYEVYCKELTLLFHRGLAGTLGFPKRLGGAGMQRGARTCRT
jgi:hypothetical protein